ERNRYSAVVVGHCHQGSATGRTVYLPGGIDRRDTVGWKWRSVCASRGPGVDGIQSRTYRINDLLLVSVGDLSPLERQFWRSALRSIRMDTVDVIIASS